MEIFDFDNVRKNIDHTSKFEALREIYPDNNILKCIGFVNLDVTDEEELPSGVVMIHPADTKLNIDSLKENMFQYLVVCKVRGKVNEEEAMRKLDDLNKAIPQYSVKSPQLKMRFKENNDDIERWAPELGEENAFVGLFYSLQPDGRTKDYYIAAKAGVPLACQQLRKYLIEKNMTFKDLVNDNAVSYVKYLAERNAKRLVYNAARVLSLPIQNEIDHSAYIPEEEEHGAKPFRAVPDYIQSIYTIQPIIYAKQDAVGIFNDVTPVSECNRSGVNHFFVCANPYEGIYMYPMNNNTKGFGLPANTGKRVVIESKKQQVEQRAKNGVIWENKKSDYHPDLEPDAFHNVDNTFESAMEESGWNRQNRRLHLVPVIIKISNPELKR